jgi:hypothetical protein
MVRGRDAADVAMVTSFGPHRLTGFEVWSDELEPGADAASLAARLRVPTRGASSARRIA